MNRKSREKDIEIASCLGQSAIRQLFHTSSPGSQSQHRQFLLQLVHDPCHNQLFLCSRKGHIQDAQFFSQAVQPHLFPNHIFSYGFSLHSPFHIHIIHADAHIHIRNHFSADILQIKFLCQTADKTNGKFQALALMNAHNAHHIRIFIQNIRFSIIHVIFFQLFHIADEMEQPIITRLFKSRRLLQKHLHIRPPLPSARQRGDIVHITRFGYNILQQFMDRHIYRFIPVRLQKAQEVPSLFLQRFLFPRRTYSFLPRFLFFFLYFIFFLCRFIPVSSAFIAAFSSPLFQAGIQTLFPLFRFPFHPCDFPVRKTPKAGF